MADLLDSLNKRDINEFHKDILQIARVTVGINNDFAKIKKKLDEYLDSYKKLINLFNKKYSNLFLKRKVTLDEVKLAIFLRNEKNIKDIFVNAAAKIAGLKSVGSTKIGTADITEAERFSAEIEKIKGKAYISYYEQDIGSTAIFLKYNKKQKMVELHYDLKSVSNKKNPEFKLVAYYALKDSFKKDIDVFSEGARFGFYDFVTETEKMEWLDKFNPRFGE